MPNRLTDWLQAEPVPGDLRRRVMGDPRLATRTGSAFRSRLAFATAALVVMVLGAGLGSILLRGSRPSGVVAVVPSPLAPSQAVSSSPTASPSAPAPSPTPTLMPPVLPVGARCRTGDLGITLGQSQGAAGTVYVPVRVVNISIHPCTISGWFGLALLDASGKQVGGDPRREPNPQGPNLAGTRMDLAPAGPSLTFMFHWSHVQSTSQPCPTAVQVELTAPDQYDHAFLPARTADGMSIAPCSPAGMGLTPLEPGS
ncbi:MAG: DUF4232 domain-containing protein [Candidatus Dormibacteria bacterium]